MTSRKRGRKATEDPRVKELERENARLQRRLARVETMLEIQKKTSELGDPPESTRERRERLPRGGRSWRGGLGKKPARLWVWLVPRCIAGASR